MHYSELYPELVKIQLSLNENWLSPSGGHVHVHTMTWPSDHCLCGQSSPGREVGSAVRMGSDLPERKSLPELFSGEQLDEVLQPPLPAPKNNSCLVISVSLQHHLAGSVCFLHKCM